MIEIIIIILVLSYREVGILCERKSWQWFRFQRVFWKTDQAKLFVKNFDWFHVSNGLATLIICWIFADHYTLINVGEDYSRYLNTVVYWVIWMTLRNWTMHIILPMPQERRYWFIVPLIGAFLEKKYGR